MTKGERRHLRNGLLFASPYIIGFAAFMLYPMVMSLYYGFCQYNVVNPPIWVGFQNFENLFFNDPVFWHSVWNTFYYTILFVPASLALSIGIAMLLNQKLAGISVFRTIFFLPSIVPIVASAVLWLWMFNPQDGLVNRLLEFPLSTVGLETPGWLADPAWSKDAIVLMSLWGIGTAMVIFLAGLADVPRNLYEVAELDGANRLQRFRHVTLPMITPTILFNLVMGLIYSVQKFTEIYVMTVGSEAHGLGGPLDSTMLYAVYLYQNSFFYLRMGYSSAMAWLMFLIIFAATVLLLITSKRWVHYQDEG
jgi:multiple sugar transport system permease protein